MSFEILTKQDLKDFGDQLINEVKALLSASGTVKEEWLKSAQVRKLLNISPGTLQNLRVNGTLKCTKIGGILFYKYEEIRKLMDGIPTVHKSKR